jgi:hypothetical protein
MADQRHHSIRSLSRKKPPDGPSSGSVANHMIVSAPFRAERPAEFPSHELFYVLYGTVAGDIKRMKMDVQSILSQ